MQSAEVVTAVPGGLAAELLEEHFNALGDGVQEVDPRSEAWTVRTEPFDRIRANPDTQRALWVLPGAASVMLLIATINTANLLLVRATTRQTDIAVRTALGASRGRLVRQQLTKNLVLVARGW